jgi:acetyl-CoA synthetase
MKKEVEETGNLNVGYLCTRHQCQLDRAQMRAMRWIGSRGEVADYTYAELDCASSRFANVLRTLGYAGGETLFTFLPKIPAQYFVLLGALKQRLVAGPLFANFGQEALLDRLADAKAKIVVTRKAGWSKLQSIRHLLPSLRHVLLVDADAHLDGEVLSYNLLMSQSHEDFTVPETSPNAPSLLHYTSGSTGKPKGALHRHGSFEYQQRTGREVLQLTPGDIYWCTADPGWVTGTTYGMIVPWGLGVSQIHFGGGFEASKWFEVLEREQVKIWYTAPTALRMLMREEEQLLRQFDLSQLQHIFSVGEPLNPEVIHWGEKILGKIIHDTWFQTETGAILITNRPGLPVFPGSMGKPVAGIEPGILDEAGEPVPEGAEGHLCLKPGWGSMFTTYINNPVAYEGKFRKGWYWTGDMARRDDQGYFWFLGRSDDVINTAGHLVSPFEVESALLEIPEIAESAVIGAPDEILFEKVVAFVSLRAGIEWSRSLELKIRLYISNKVSTTATPQELLVIDKIPKNNSGKIMRRLLKARYLGLEAGDVSTLEV